MRVTDSIPDKSVINSKWLAAIAFHIIGLGILAIVFPIFFTLTSALVFGWIFIGAGICQLGMDTGQWHCGYCLRDFCVVELFV